MERQFDQACSLARQHYLNGNRGGSAQILKELILGFPEQPMPYYLLSEMAIEDGQDHIALVLLQQAVALNPGNPEIWTNLGGVMKANEHRDKAMACYQKALQVDKNFAPALKGLAGCYVNQGNPAPGIVYAERALKQEGPHCVVARNDLALLLLENGKWEEGFKLYRHRAEWPGYHVRDYGPVPRWEGQKVGTLALHAEQGLGDEILFASCIRDILPFADRIVGECADRLLPLFKRSFPSIPWYGTHEQLMDREANGIHAWERLGDLPHWFRKSPADCPGLPYLRADYAKVQGYRERLRCMGNGPYIGFAWLGGTAGTHRLERRAPRDHWAKLVKDAPGIKVSLQYGEEGPRHAEKFGLHHWPSVIDDIDECAALIMALDCVVSSPQTVVHMAGALGKRCLVAMASKPAWRYQISGPMPWYKSIELVRQTGDDWEPVFFNIGEKLAAHQRSLQAAE